MITRPPVTAAAASRLGGNRVKVFVSSTSRDLSEYRAAAIRSLRRLGHQVTAMEEFTATAAYPLDRVLELVRDADAYVVIVAWRYGFLPETARAKNLPKVEDPNERRSITEWEYLAARENPDRPILAFLLADSAAWPPQDMDGFDPRSPGDVDSPERVRIFRARLMSDHIVSFFSTPDQLVLGRRGDCDGPAVAPSRDQPNRPGQPDPGRDDSS